MSDRLSVRHPSLRHRRGFRSVWWVAVLALLGSFLAATPARADTALNLPSEKYQNWFSHLCITPAGGSSDLNVTIVQYTCDGLGIRSYTGIWNQDAWAYELQNTANHLCLSPAGGNTGLNTVLVQYTCDNDPARLWTFNPTTSLSGSGPLELKNAKSGLCISPADGSTDLNAALVQYVCDNDPARNYQVFRPQIIQSTNAGGYCLGIAGSSNTLNNVAASDYCDRMAYRLWHLVPFGKESSTTFFLEDVGDTWCLSPAGAATGLNVAIVQYACDSNTARSWRLLTTSPGYGKLQNMASGLCISPAGGGTGVNVTMVQSSCDNDASRIWHVYYST